MSSIALGFGSTETDRENKTMLEIQELVADILKEHNHARYDFFSDVEQIAIEEAVRELSAKSYLGYEAADKAKVRPERYGRFSVSQAFSGWNYFVRCEWFHINSRHPMSPDGMALIQTVKTESFTCQELIPRE